MWTESGGLQSVPLPDGETSGTPEGTSPDGRYIHGSYASLGGTTPADFIWSEATGPVHVPSLPGGDDLSTVASINNEGVAVGFSTVGFTSTGVSQVRAFRWSIQDGIEALPLPDPSDVDHPSLAYRTLDDGRIYGRSNSGAWLYSETDGFEMLDIPVNFSGGNSDASFIIGGVTDPDTGGNMPAYWTPGGGVELLPVFDDTRRGGIYGFSDDGSVIVGDLNRFVSGSELVVWVDQGEPVTIEAYAESFGVDLGDWNITRISGVSADGTTIVGTAVRGQIPFLQTEGFVLTIPAPGTIGVLGVAFLAARRRR